jgi:hypothetical protein
VPEPEASFDLHRYVQALIVSAEQALNALTHLRQDLDVLIGQTALQRSHLEVLQAMLESQARRSP